MTYTEGTVKEPAHDVVGGTVSRGRGWWGNPNTPVLQS